MVSAPNFLLFSNSEDTVEGELTLIFIFGV
jgi:hypothetical protein